MRNKTNKRTLKRRIRKLLNLGFFINIVLFSVLLFVVCEAALGIIIVTVTSNKCTTIASEMSSINFLKAEKISSLKEFKSDSKETASWIDDINNTILKTENSKYSLDTYGLSDLFFIKIDLYNKTVYSNYSSGKQSMNNSFTDFVFTISKTSMNVEDSQGNNAGTVTVQINPNYIIYFLISIISVLTIIGICLIILNSIINRLFTIPVIKPLEKLNEKLIALADEDIEAAMNNEIKLKMPLKEIETLVNSTNAMMQKMRNYSNILEDQNEELEIQNEELAISKTAIEAANNEIFNSKQAIKLMLDNTGQGFLSFDSSLKIDENYSKSSEVFFKSGLKDKKLSSLLYENDQKQEDFLDTLLEKIFSEQDERKRKLYIPLLPEEITIDGLSLKIEYKSIKDENNMLEKVIVIITDITDKKLLQNQMDLERKTLKMVVKVIVNIHDFLNCINDYDDFTNNRINLILKSDKSSKDILYEVYRNVHTFKGSFSQFDMNDSVLLLHSAEDVLSKFLEEDISIDVISSTLKELNLHKTLNKDMAKLYEILGEEFFKKNDFISVNKNNLMEIEKKMKTLLSPSDLQALLPYVERLRYKSLKKIIKNYNEVVQTNAGKLEKLINLIIFEGEDVIIDPDKYYNFNKSLINIFKNIVDHGIETCEERLRKGKKETGNILVSMELQGNNLQLCITDDGNGIDLSKIRQRSLEKGLYPVEEIEKLSKDELIKIILDDNFSTKDNVTELSGRGMGLSSVASEVKALNGTMSIESEENIGTSFIFNLPI